MQNIAFWVPAMSNDFSDGYYGDINLNATVSSDKLVSFEMLKPNYNVAFHNAEGEIGRLDFNGPGLSFEGNAEMSAIVFIDWIAKAFSQRLKDEYDRGFADGKASQNTP